MTSELSDDMLYGIEQIATFLGMPKRKAYHMASTKKQLPCFKIGALWCARKSTLRQFIEELEAAA